MIVSAVRTVAEANVATPAVIDSTAKPTQAETMASFTVSLGSPGCLPSPNHHSPTADKASMMAAMTITPPNAAGLGV